MPTANPIAATPPGPCLLPRLGRACPGLCGCGCLPQRWAALGRQSLAACGRTWAASCSELLQRPKWAASQAQAAFFLFLYFLKTIFIEIYFWFHNLQFYTPTARQGGGRGPAAHATPCRVVGTYM